MKAKIVSDGFRTEAFTADGAKIAEVVAARWNHASAGEPAVVELTLGLYEVELAGEVRFLVGHPVDGGLRRVAKIEFVDGTEWSAP